MPRTPGCVCGETFGGSHGGSLGGLAGGDADERSAQAGEARSDGKQDAASLTTCRCRVHEHVRRWAGTDHFGPA